MKSDNRTLLISVDADGQIGSGHLMRCLSIADAAADKGAHVVFAVSNEYAHSLAQNRGYEAVCVKRNEMRYSVEDARTLGGILVENDAGALLVDSYAVDEDFFIELERHAGSCSVFFIDDFFTFSAGRACEPKFWPVAGIINYSFGTRMADYERVYAGKSVALLIGPKYAPVRRTFSEGAYEVREQVRKVLITSGSTNPGHVLERMCAAALDVLPNCQIDVVVGAKAQFDDKDMAAQCNILTGIDDMAHLMRSCDLAISAAGTTLYELATVGVPTVAIPIVENQMENVKGFEELELGRTVSRLDASVQAIAHEMAGLAFSELARKACSERMRALMKKNGASLIADALMRSHS